MRRARKLKGILETVSTVVFALACGSAAGQGVMKTAPAPNRNITPASPQRQNPPAGRVMPGRIEGFVYWDAHAIAHNPAGACDGFSVNVIAGGQVLAAAAGQFGAKAIAPVRSFLANGTALIYDACTYAYDNLPENTPLRVELTITQPTSFSVAVAPATPIVGPVTIINAQCNMLPNIVTATLADLTAHWGSCQDMAFDVNFQLTPASLATRAAALTPGTRTPVQTALGAAGATSAPSSSGMLLTPGAQTTLLGASQQPNNAGTNSTIQPLVPRGGSGGGGAAKADDLNPQPYPPKGTSTSGGVTPQVGASQTMSAQGSAPGGSLVRNSNNATALSATPSSKPRASVANTTMTVCEAEIAKGQALTVISAVDGKSVPQIPFAGGSAPGAPIIAGVFSGAGVFTPGKHYIIQGCGFGIGTGQVFISSGFYSASDPKYFQVKLYPNQWSDQRIDAEVDPSASGSAQPVLLVVLTASTKTAVSQMGAGVGEATAFGFSFAPSGVISSMTPNVGVLTAGAGQPTTPVANTSGCTDTSKPHIVSIIDSTTFAAPNVIQWNASYEIHGCGFGQNQGTVYVSGIPKPPSYCIGGTSGPFSAKLSIQHWSDTTIDFSVDSNVINQLENSGQCIYAHGGNASLTVYRTDKASTVVPVSFVPN